MIIWSFCFAATAPPTYALNDLDISNKLNLSTDHETNVNLHVYLIQRQADVLFEFQN